MHILSSPARLFALAILLFLPHSALAHPRNSILLSSVKSLTLHASRPTTSRRLAPIPQLTCSGPGCAHHKIETLRCINTGTSYGAEDIEWSCAAELPEEFKLGATEVVCEGYASADDERVLRGSCGVEYRLLLTEKGEERYGSSWWGGKKGKGKSGTGSGTQRAGAGEDSDIGGWLFGMLFVGVLLWIVYSAYTNRPQAGRAGAPRRPRNNWGGGGGDGGGWGGGGADDPPPPYPGKPSQARQQQEEGWRPGFWSGTAAGAAAAYLAGNRGGRRAETREVPNTGGWFGGGGGGGARGGGYNWGESGGGGSSASEGSSQTRTSTGFGSTRRR